MKQTFILNYLFVLHFCQVKQEECNMLYPDSCKLSQDAAANYTDKLLFLEQRRDFSGSNPEGADADIDTGFPVQRRSQVAASKPSAAGRPSSLSDPAATNQELKEDLIKWHYNIVQMCKKVGIQDVCQTYKQTRLDNIISGCSSKELQCKLCKKVFSSHQKLRNHIKVKHLKKTSHYCSECRKYFADSGSLKLHMVSHDPTASKFACKACPRQFSTKSQSAETSGCAPGQEISVPVLSKQIHTSTRGQRT